MSDRVRVRSAEASEALLARSPPPLPVGLVPEFPHLSPKHLAQLENARRAMRKLRRAVVAARVDGWSVGIFGVATALFGMTDPASFMLGLSMFGAAIVELRTARQLQRLHASASRLLGWNQVILGMTLFAYGLFQLIGVFHGQNEYTAIVAREPQLGSMLGPIQDFMRMVLLAVYAGVMSVALVGQGSMAAYYFTRRRAIDAYCVATPSWILELQRAGVVV